PSHREYLFGPMHLPAVDLSPQAVKFVTYNPNWINKAGKYLTLRPRPVDLFNPAVVTARDKSLLTPAQQAAYTSLQFPLDLDLLTPVQQDALAAMIVILQAQGRLFPYPADRYGDVKNLDGAPGGCDSFLMDVNAPIHTSADGRRYKMM